MATESTTKMPTSTHWNNQNRSPGWYVHWLYPPSPASPQGPPRSLPGAGTQYPMPPEFTTDPSALCMPVAVTQLPTPGFGTMRSVPATSAVFVSSPWMLGRTKTATTIRTNRNTTSVVVIADSIFGSTVPAKTPIATANSVY